MATEAGSGTLAGNAHQESFERLCAATARSISECINRQFCRRILREAFPDQPQLAVFELAAQQEDDLTEQAQLIATLSSAGFRPSAETVSEMMGFEVEAVEPTPATPSPFSPGISPITNRETDTPSTPDASAPLTQAELDALQSLSKGFAAEQLAQDADTIYTALADAIAPEDTAIENEKGHYHPDGRECPAQPGNCRLDKQKEVEQDSTKGAKKKEKKKGKEKKGEKKKEKAKESSDEAQKDADEKKEKRPSFYPQNWKPLTISDRMTPAKAKETLERGITETDPLGNKLTMDGSILTHWSDAGKSAEDINERLAHLPVIKKCIKHPAEIWEDEETGIRTYMAAYCPNDEKKIYPIAFTVQKDKSKIRTYYLSKRGIDTKRKGKLLYQAKK